MQNDARFPPSLTGSQLREIRDRNKGNPDIKAPLWEIKKFHVICRQAKRVADYVEQNGTCHSVILQSLKSDLAGEPCLVEGLGPEEQQICDEILSKRRAERGENA